MSSQDQQFGTMSVKMGFITMAQLSECLRTQKMLQEQGKPISFRQLLMERGYLTREQIAAIDSQAETMCEDQYFGRYQIIEQLGSGGMGRVYKVYDSKLHREVALKVLLVGSLASEKDIARFMREVKITAHLNHPNIVRVYDIDQHEGQHYFTMDLVRGESLEKLLASFTSKRQFVDIMIKVAKAIHVVHLEGIIHRDLKPANIMIDQSGEPKIMDFGLAKTTDDKQKLSHTGIPIGTLQYMPPEQAEGRLKDIDERSDVYSLGAILYHILSGRAPFSGKSAFDIIRHIQHEDPVPPSKLRTSVPKNLEIICLKALDKNRSLRYQSAIALAEDLQRFKQGHEITARPRSQWQQLMIKVSRYRALVILAIVFLLMLMVLFGYSHLQIRAEVIKTRRAREVATRERDLARKNAEDAKTSEAKAKLNHSRAMVAMAKAQISTVEAKISGVQAYLAMITTLVSVSQDYQEAGNKYQQLLKLCRDSEHLLQSLNLNELADAQPLQKKCTILLQRIQRLSKKARHLFAYQIHPNTHRVVQDIALPKGCEQYPTLSVSWKLTALSPGTYRNLLSMLSPSRQQKVMQNQTGRAALVIWNFRTRKVEQVFWQQHTPTYVAFSNNDRYFVTGDTFGSIKLWDLTTAKIWQQRMPKTVKGKYHLRSLAFSPDNKLLLAITSTHTSVFTCPEMEIVKIIKHGGKYCTSSCFSPDSKKMALCGLDTFPVKGQFTIGGTRLWEVDRWGNGEFLKFHGEGLCFSKDSQEVVLGTLDKIIFWNPEKNRQRMLEGHKGKIICLRCSPDGRFLASLGKDQVLMVRAVDTGKRIFTIPIPYANTYAVAFDNELLSLWSSKNITIYQLEPSLSKRLKASPRIADSFTKTLKSLNLDSEVVDGSDIIMSPCQRFIAAYVHALVLLWNIESNTLRFLGYRAEKQPNLADSLHHDQAWQLAFSSDGSRLACTGRKTLRLWDVHTGKRLTYVPLAGDYVLFHPQNRNLLLSVNMRGMRFWVYNAKKLRSQSNTLVYNIHAMCLNSQATLVALGGENAISILRLPPPQNHLWKMPRRVQAKITLPMREVSALCFAAEYVLAAGSNNCRFATWDVQTGKKLDNVRLPAPIKKIFYDHQDDLYWIVTSSSVFIYRKTAGDKIRIYPLELYPGYKKKPVTISSDCRYMALMLSNFETLIFCPR